jgi:hypothetical protein
MTRGFGRFLRHNTIALLALFLALGGTTYAASTALIGRNTVASPQVVNGSLQTIDLSKKARKALKGNRGLRGFTGAKGATGAAGAQGAAGAAGHDGSARAYAYVNPDDVTPTLNTDRTKGFTAVRRAPSTVAGVYCLLAPGISPDTTSPVVSVDYHGSLANETVKVRSTHNECAATEFEVVVLDGTTTSSAVPFTIVVP